MPTIEGLSGTAVVSVGGTVVLEVAQGTADSRTGVACGSATVFQIASVTKQITATVVTLLAERGLLALDDPITRWFPDAEARWRPVTVHHLLSHTAGIGHWDDLPCPHPATRSGLVTSILAVEPGTGWRYSSPGYLLLGRIVELATGKPWSAVLRDEITAPLGLTATTVGPPPERAANGHHDGIPVPSPDLALLAGTGDVWSTAADIARFTATVHSGHFGAALTQRVTEIPHGEPFNAHSYGYGVYLATVAGAPALFHHGDNPGFRALALWLPRSATAVAILTNDGATDLPSVLARVLTAS